MRYLALNNIETATSGFYCIHRLCVCNKNHLCHRAGADHPEPPALWEGDKRGLTWCKGSPKRSLLVVKGGKAVYVGVKEG